MDAAVYVHIDLDALDPEVFGAVGSPVGGGLTADELLVLVSGLAERFEIAGLGITEYEPGSGDDRGVLEPLVAELVKVCGAEK